jgi:hypothetical protein
VEKGSIADQPAGHLAEQEAGNGHAPSLHPGKKTPGSGPCPSDQARGVVLFSRGNYYSRKSFTGRLLQSKSVHGEITTELLH